MTESSVKIKFTYVNEQRKLNIFNEMNQYSWTSLMDIPDINECLNTFSITIFDMFNRNFP